MKFYSNMQWSNFNMLSWEGQFFFVAFFIAVLFDRLLCRSKWTLPRVHHEEVSLSFAPIFYSIINMKYDKNVQKKERIWHIPDSCLVDIIIAEIARWKNYVYSWWKLQHWLKALYIYIFSSLLWCPQTWVR